MIHHCQQIWSCCLLCRDWIVWDFSSSSWKNDVVQWYFFFWFFWFCWKLIEPKARSFVLLFWGNIVFFQQCVVDWAFAWLTRVLMYQDVVLVVDKIQILVQHKERVSLVYFLSFVYNWVTLAFSVCILVLSMISFLFWRSSSQRWYKHISLLTSQWS